MKTKALIAAGVILVIVVLVATLPLSPRSDPRDLTHWVKVSGATNWSTLALKRNPEAQFCHGLNLISTNLVTMIGRVPKLAAIPIIGKRFFENVSYALDSNVTEDQLAEAYQWIKKSADQGFPPAKEAEKLFIGKIPAGKSSEGTLAQ